MDEAGRGPDRFLLAIAAGAVALIAVAVAAVLLLGERGPRPAPDPASPAGVVQAYVEAVRAGEWERARTHLSRSAREAVDRSQREPFPRHAESPNVQRRVLIEPVEVGAERAEVKVTISTFSARTEPFSSNTWHSEVTVRLVREEGAWRISQPAEPYPFLF